MRKTRKYKRVETPATLRAWLIANPKCPVGGRKPKKFLSYCRKLEQEDAEALALACCQILLRNEPTPPERRYIYLKVPFDFQRTQSVLTHGQYVSTDPTGWWIILRFNVKNVLDRLCRAGLIFMSFKQFQKARLAAQRELDQIQAQIQWYSPDSVYEEMEKFVNKREKG